MTITEITEICEKYSIRNYQINVDGSVDVDGHVNLIDKNLERIPVKFSWIMGKFNISKNKLATLKGAPDRVDGDFNCSDNILTSLGDGPTIVGGNFNCGNNLLRNLVGAPKKIHKDFHCFINCLLTLEGGPEQVDGDYYAYSNDFNTLAGSPKIVSGNFIVAGNPQLMDLRGCPEKIKGNFYLDSTLVSTFSNHTHCIVGGRVRINHQEGVTVSQLPTEILFNEIHMKYVLKYQHYYEVWNSDLTFNASNFSDLIEDIVDGLL
jgi:hypothetical protein